MDPVPLSLPPMWETWTGFQSPDFAGIKHLCEPVDRISVSLLELSLTK